MPVNACQTCAARSGQRYFPLVVAKISVCGHSLTANSYRLASAVNESDATDLLTALYDRWYMALVRYALRTTCNYELAEDLAQDTFMQLYQALRAGKNIEHPKAWTICVLRRAMNRQMKYRNLHEQLDELEIAGAPWQKYLAPRMSETFFRCSHRAKRKSCCSDLRH